MSDERVIQSSQPKSVATFTVLSDGTAIPASMDVLSIVVTREVNRIPTATIAIKDGSAAQQGFSISNGEEFVPGKEIEIRAGYRADEETIFKGFVVKHAIKVRKNVSMLHLVCKHSAVKMTTRTNNAYYLEVTDNDVAEQLCRAHGLTARTDGNPPINKQLVQYNSTDWDFMLCRAEANGFWVVCEDDAIAIGPPDTGQPAAVTVQFGATVHDLDAEIDARVQYGELKAVGWNPAEQELLDNVLASDPATPAAGNIAAADLSDATGNASLEVRHAGLPETELQAWANSAALRKKLAKIRGSVRTDGTAEAVPGKALQLNGAGERFEGLLLITGVRHQIEKGNWQTVLQFGGQPASFAETFAVAQPAAGALLPPVHGLQIGIVTSLEDPEQEDRIQVRLPMVQGAGEGAWMRVASLDAGADRGMFFRPEIGDEVIVGFLDNDPRHGVVLGMLHSSAKPAPIRASDENHEKGYVSRSELKILVDDDKRILTLSTPGGHVITLNDDEQKISIVDSNNNSIVMSSDGITIESARDLTMTAATNLTAEAGANAELSGGATMKVEGAAGAELSSGGNTTLRGAIVQIN